MISHSAENTARGPIDETRKRSKSDHQKPGPQRQHAEANQLAKI